MKKIMVGIDIGGTKCAITIGTNHDTPIQILDKRHFLTGIDSEPQEVLDKIYANIDALLSSCNLTSTDIFGIGISCGGPLDSKTGRILSPPNLPKLENVPIVDLLRQRYNTKVKLNNDADACAVAEWKYGAGRGYSNVVFLTFGTGLGAGLILGGKLYAGTNDMAGEVGHIRLAEFGPVGYGKQGSFEGFCSGNGISQMGYTEGLKQFQTTGKWPSYYNDEIGIASITAKSIGDAAEAGDSTAIEVYKKSGTYLGKGLSLIIDFLNPEVIIIGSVYARSTNLLKSFSDAVMKKEVLERSLSVCKVVPAELGEKLGDYAALAIATMNE